jgi:hypothetical protein
MYTDNPLLARIQSIGGAWYIKGPGLVGWKQITAVQDNSGVALIVRIGSGNTPLPDGSEFNSGGHNPTSPDLVYTISHNLEFDLKVADKTWTFDSTGTLTLPEGGTIKGGGTGTDVTVVASTGTNAKTWTFGADGSLTFPSGLTINDTNTITAPDQSYLNLTSSGQTGGLDLYWSSTLTNTSSVQSAQIDVGLVADGHNMPGVKILAYDGRYENPNSLTNDWMFDYYGRLTFPDGTSFGDSKWKSLSETMAVVLDDEFVKITPINAYGTPQNSWTFSSTGTLTFPNNTVQTTAFTGTVAYSNITGAPAVVNRTTGSWILATGANTVSITVPANSNYQMWVNGNIPNGIVEWNATVNVSNTNVPAIGSQYGWYYAAGNALVLTSMPNQIVGTAGVISTSTGYAGTTSNVFSFGITNNSVSTQTVYWGYTTL